MLSLWLLWFLLLFLLVVVVVVVEASILLFASQMADMDPLISRCHALWPAHTAVINEVQFRIAARQKQRKTEALADSLQALNTLHSSSTRSSYREFFCPTVLSLLSFW